MMIENTQGNGQTEEPLFSRGVLRSVVNLFPKSEFVICTAVRVTAKGDPCDTVEHKKRKLEKGQPGVGSGEDGVRSGREG